MPTRRARRTQNHHHAVSHHGSAATVRKEKIILIVLGIVFIMALASLVSNYLPQKNHYSLDTVVKKTYACVDDKSITAAFSGDIADLELSDGRRIVLNAEASSPTWKYSNTDGSFIFWNQGRTAYVQENGNSTFQNCLSQ